MRFYCAAAHYSEISRLMAVTCEMIANMTNKYTPDEIRRAVWILNLILITDQLMAFKFAMRTNNFNWIKIAPLNSNEDLNKKKNKSKINSIVVILRNHDHFQSNEYFFRTQFVYGRKVKAKFRYLAPHFTQF